MKPMFWKRDRESKEIRELSRLAKVQRKRIRSRRPLVREIAMSIFQEWMETIASPETRSETVDKIAAAAVRAGEALEKALDEQYPE